MLHARKVSGHCELQNRLALQTLAYDRAPATAVRAYRNEKNIRSKFYAITAKKRRCFADLRSRRTIIASRERAIDSVFDSKIVGNTVSIFRPTSQPSTLNSTWKTESTMTHKPAVNRPDDEETRF